MADAAPAPKGPLDRIGSFRMVYAGILVYVLLCIASLEGAKTLLLHHFHRAVADAAIASPAQGRVVPQIQARIGDLLRSSPWTRFGGVQVRALVLAADGRTPIYLEGRTLPPPPGLGGDSAFEEAGRLLPAITEVAVSIPPASLLAGAIFVGYGCALVPALFLHYRRSARREAALVDAAVAAHAAAAERARSIQSELDKVRARLAHVEPAEREHAGEIRTLHAEREALQAKLRELSEREARLHDQLVRTGDLDREREALEDLLEEAMQDLGQKEREIGELEERLRSAARAPAASPRAVEQLARRLRALYPNLEIDDRAIRGIAELGDESLRLRAEEALKRLDADPASAAVRRKVGGLPSGLAIFELAFAGKGRIYFRRGAQRPYRILAVGGKASQKADLDYLSRLPLE